LFPHATKTDLAVIRKFRHQSDAWLQMQERRKRQDEAPRLKNEVPSLVELRIELSAVQSDSTISASGHIKLIPVDSAPAMFEIPCTNSDCKDGGHDLTGDLIRGLKAGRPIISGDDPCRGSIGSAECRRTLHYVARAKYK